MVCGGGGGMCVVCVWCVCDGDGGGGVCVW